MEPRQGAGRYLKSVTFKLRLDEKGLWRMVRWIDDPLNGFVWLRQDTRGRGFVGTH